MQTQSPPLLEIPAQKNVITLQEGMARTNNWRESVKHLYGNKEHNIPRAVFMPFTDINELVKLREIITEYAPPPSVEKIPIYIVGVRAYFTLNAPISITDPATQENILDAVLVAVYQVNPDGRTGDRKYEYNCNYPTYDLIIQVPKKADDLNQVLCPIVKKPYKRIVADDEVYHSIYDITQPCPQLCDASSDLH